MMKSKYVLVFLLVFGIASVSSADPWGRDYSSFDEDTTAVVYGVGGTADAAYYYGFEIAPSDTSVDLDGVAASGVGDFHTLNQPDFDLVNGLATDIAGAGAEHLLRTDFTNSLWRAQFLSDNAYTVEAKVNLLGTGDEGTEGVFGLYQATGYGSLDLRIGTTIVRDDTHGVDIATGLDNTGWHVWRVARAGSGFYVYRDGVQVGGIIAPGGNSNKTFAGDYSSTLGGDWEMEYYVVDTVPEPATMALLGLGGLALLRRRRA